MPATLAAKPRRRTLGLTALIDVVFILLMFFMLTSSFTRERQFDLSAPVASAAAPATAPRQLLLGADGALQPVDGEIFPDDAAIRANLAADEPLILRPAPDASVQTLVSALARLKALGFDRLSLGNPLAPPEPRP
ncbi:MAG: biopolymer transporter ExbD [Porticoccaceae bacterium]|jgi:biopolymer transport protein ExbD|nr:biopolymer transporter ExbD [Porticoccaceae bacterium]MEA3301150.1 biopolymer transporter ExbD [Pseudomonadota bacterium]HLS99486.1 biopolymer transporter ExbD [Porticoccaceae bacterium]